MFLAILGITYADGHGMVPCLLKDEQLDDEPFCRVYASDQVPLFAERLMSYHEKLGRNKLIGAFMKPVIIPESQEKKFFEWDNALGPRVVMGFI